MRRPMAVYGFTFLGCSLSCVLLGVSFVPAVVILLGALAAVLLILGHRSPENRIIQGLQGCCLAALCAFITLYATVASSLWPVVPLYHTRVSVEMTVIQQASTYDTAEYYVVGSHNLPGLEGKEVRIRLQTDRQRGYLPGDVLSGQVELCPVPETGKARYYSDRIFLQAKTLPDESLAVVGQKRGIPYYAMQVRQAIKQRVYDALDGDPAALVTGICIGDTSGLSQQTVRDFNACGMSHMVAVSGLHTSTVSALLVGLFLFMKTGRRYAKLLSILFVWGFVLMVGAPYSAIRAGVMFTVAALCAFFFRMADGLNTLGLAVLAILIFYPLGAGDIGFMASVSACLGIILLHRPVTEFSLGWLPEKWQKRKGIQWMAAGMSVTGSAFTGNLPVCLLGFFTISPISPFTNLPGVPLASLVLPLGLVAGLLYQIPGLSFLARVLMWLAGLCAKGLLAIAHFFGGFPFSRLSFSGMWCGLALAVLVIAGSLLYRFRDTCKPAVRRLVAAGLAVILFLSCFVPVYGKDTYEILVISNGYQNAVAITGREGTVIIGCGNPYALQTQLASRRVMAVDALILPDFSSYQQDLTQLVHAFPVEQLVVSEQTVEKGLLIPAQGQWERLSFDRTVAVGGILVTADQTFTSFEITLNGRRFLYACSPKQGDGEYDGVIYHPSAVPQETGYPGEETMVFRVTPDTLFGYKPRYLW